MENQRFDFVERTLIVFIVVFLALCVAVVAEAAYPQPAAAKSVVGWQPPPIPFCNKPIWDRIRVGCDE